MTRAEKERAAAPGSGIGGAGEGLTSTRSVPRGGAPYQPKTQLIAAFPLLKATGLEKRCPRCGRLGKVYRYLNRRGGYSVIWGDPPRNPYGLPVDLDDVTLRELVDPALGCGYDGVTT